MSTTIVSVENLSKRFVLTKDKSVKERIIYRGKDRGRENFWALRDVSLEIGVGSTVGLVGHNGSGKSTLLKAIGGIIAPTTGSVRRRGRLAALLELGAGFHPDLTGRENVYLNAAILGMSRQEVDAQFDDILAFSEIGDFIDTQVKFYSSGMYVRLAFAVAIHSDPDLLLVDEVLAVGDEPFQRKCLDKIAEFQREGRTIILVSHSAEQVGALCDRVVVMEHGRCVYDGDTQGGIRELRESFARGREARADEDARPEPLVIDEVSVNGGGPLVVGDDLEFTVDFTLSEAVEPWVIGLALETAIGAPVYRMRSDDAGVTLPTEPGSYRTRVRWEGSRIGIGQFNVSLGAATIAGRTILVRNPAAVVDVGGETKGRGPVSFTIDGDVSAR